MSEPQVLNAPDRIYLQSGELIDDVLFGEMREVTWCDHAIGDSDVPYVRADLHAAAEARVQELEAEQAQLIAALETVEGYWTRKHGVQAFMIDWPEVMRVLIRYRDAAVDAEKGNDDG